MVLRFVALVLALFLAACGGGGGGSSNTPPPPPVLTAYSDPTVYSSAATASLATPSEFIALSQHRLTIGAAALDYTAAAGHLTARRLGMGAPQASFFFVAYTLNGAAPATRPVTFFYNGGPGSATVWLHIGSFGPKRLVTGMPATDAPTPYALVDNTESLLDVSDLVFVNAIGSGYSQAIAPSNNRSFWGVDVDAEVFRDFVMTWLAANNRASSPKFLFGESYGGPRAALMADLLESAGTGLEGVVLQSPAMNYNSNCAIFIPPRTGCGTHLPSYGAAGAFFNLSTPSPPQSQLEPFMAQLRAFARDRYSPALLAGGPPDPALLADLSLASGMPASRWQQRFNMDPTFYRVNLIPGTLLGGYDARVTQPNNSINGEQDPSSTLITTSFGYRVVEYLANLGYTTPSNYTLLSNAIQVWNFSHDGNEVPDTIPDLASALAQNPRLKVLAVNGYHDLVTPFHRTELDLARLGTNPNISVKNYPGGHMTYLDDTSRALMKVDLAEFYRSALAN